MRFFDKFKKQEAQKRETQEQEAQKREVQEQEAQKQEAQRQEAEPQMTFVGGMGLSLIHIYK